MLYWSVGLVYLSLSLGPPDPRVNILLIGKRLAANSAATYTNNWSESGVA